MLDPIAQLAEHILGHIRRILRDEKHANALGADQPRHLFNLGNQPIGRVVEQQMRLVEEKDQLWLLGTPTSGSSSKSSDNNHRRKVA